MPDMKLPSYFYGDEAMQFTYFRIPCQLITHPRYKHLSTDSKLLCRFAPPLWLTDTITRLLDQYEGRRGKLPMRGVSASCYRRSQKATSSCCPWRMRPSTSRSLWSAAITSSCGKGTVCGSTKGVRPGSDPPGGPIHQKLERSKTTWKWNLWRTA